jgi:hypothetical protein
MGVRSYIRDILSLYVAWEVLNDYFSKSQPDVATALAALLLGGITAWFLGEKIGLIPRG